MPFFAIKDAGKAIDNSEVIKTLKILFKLLFFLFIILSKQEIFTALKNNFITNIGINKKII